MPDNPYAKWAAPANPYAGYVAVGDPDPTYQYKGPEAQARLERSRQEVQEGPLRLQILQNQARKAAADADATDQGSLDPATRTYYAQQVLAGAPMPSLGMGKQASAAKQEIMAEVARMAGAKGLNGADLATQIAHYKAGSKAIGNLENMAATIGVNEQTAMANGQQFLDRSTELPGQTRFSPLNAVSNFIQRKFGGTTVSAMDAAYGTFTNEYAKVVAGSPSGAGTLSDSARHEAQATMDGNGSLAQKQAAFDQMKADMANRMTAIHGGVANAYKALTNQPGYQVPDSTQQLAVPGLPGARSMGGGGPSGSTGGPPSGFGIGSGPGGMTIDPAKQASASRIEAMLADRSVPDEQIRAFATAAGATPDSVDANLAFRKAHPSYKGGYNASAMAMTPKPNVAFSLAGGTTPFGTAMMAGANALSGNTLDNLTADPALARAGLEGASAANPGSAITGNILGTGLGAAATELGVGAGAAKFGIGAGSAWLPRAADAIYGGFSGAGANDDGSRIGGALAGAGLGVAGGMVGRGMFGAIGRRLGNGPAALSPADASVLMTAQKTGLPTIAAQLGEAQRLGVPMSLADTTPSLTSLGGAVVRRSPDAAQIAQDAFLPRARGQIDRLGQAVTRDLGPIGNVPQMSADLLKQARTEAKPLYDAAYAAPGAGATYPQIEPFLSKPSVQNALGRARNIAAEEGRDPTSLGFDLDAQGNPTLTRVPSWQTLDYVKRGLDDTVDAARDPLTQRLNTAGNAINDTRRSFLSTLDTANPDYKAARAAYAGPMEATNALRAGQDAFTANPNQLGVDVANTSPGNIPQMQLGYRGALMDKANAARFSANPFDATLGTPSAEQRLATLYPNNPGNSNLLRTRDLEGGLARSQNAILGNSMTAERQIADQAFAGSPLVEAGLHAGAAFATGGGSIPGTAARLAGVGLKDKIALGLGSHAVAKADAIAPTIFNPDPAASAASLSDLLTRNDAYRAYINGMAARKIGGMFGAGIGTAGGSSLFAPVGP